MAFSNFYFYYFYPHLRTWLCILERGEGREKGRETSMRERNINWLTFVCAPTGDWTATQACALTGNRTYDPSVCRTTPNQLSHTDQSSVIFRITRSFNIKLIWVDWASSTVIIKTKQNSSAWALRLKEITSQGFITDSQREQEPSKTELMLSKFLLLLCMDSPHLAEVSRKTSSLIFWKCYRAMNCCNFKKVIKGM